MPSYPGHQLRCKFSCDTSTRNFIVCGIKYRGIVTLLFIYSESSIMFQVVQ